MNKLPFAAFLLLVTPLSLPADSNVDKADKVIQNFLLDTGIPSVSYSFFNIDGSISSSSAGVKDVLSKTPATDQTYYDVGSNLKVITAAAILQLVDQRIIKLDAPVNTYLKEKIPALDTFSDTPVLVSHLLNHLSGIPTSASLSAIWSPSEFRNKKEIYESISLTSKPGVNYQYCNVCFLIAADIVENMSGISYSDYVIKHILEPSGVQNYGFLKPTPSMYPNMALPFHMRYAQAYPTSFYISATYGAGGAWFTTEQLAKILQFLFRSNKGNGALSKGTYKKLITEYTQIAGYNGGYGLGIGLEKFDSGIYPFHQGSMPGYISQYIFDPETGNGLVLSANVTAANDAESQIVWLRDQLFALVVPSFSTPNKNYPIRKRSPLNDSAIKELPRPHGIYKDESQETEMRIIELSGALFFENPRGDRFQITRLSKTEFVLNTENESLVIQFTNTNIPDSLTLLGPDGNKLITLNYYKG